jgi:hypothetical protein
LYQALFVNIILSDLNVEFGVESCSDLVECADRRVKMDTMSTARMVITIRVHHTELDAFAVRIMLVSAVVRRAGRRLEIIFWIGKGLAGHGVLRTVKGLVDLNGGYGCYCGGSKAA